VTAKNDIGTAAVGRPGSADSAATKERATRPGASAAYAPLSEAAPPPSDLAPPDADRFYADSLRILKESEIPFLVAGTFAVNCYTGINRATKDLDIFIRPEDILRTLAHFQQAGYGVEFPFPHWLAKVRSHGFHVDFIFSSGNGVARVDEAWFEHARRRSREARVIFGHWSALGLVQRDNVIGLDTGCVWGGALTAFDLDRPRPPIAVPCAEHQRIRVH